MPTPLSGTVNLVGVWRFVKRDARTGAIVSDRAYRNVVPTVARAAIAAQLGASGTYPAKITYAAVGSSGTAPAAGDTQLGTETYRKAVAGASNVSNVLTATAFFNESQANGTLAEAGLFGDGSSSQATSTANSGILFSHVAISETKTSSETLTITWTLTIS